MFPKCLKLFQNCNEENVPCPSVYVERVGFEMDKRYKETKLQVLISPAILIARDAFEVHVVFSTPSPPTHPKLSSTCTIQKGERIYFVHLKYCPHILVYLDSVDDV